MVAIGGLVVAAVVTTVGVTQAARAPAAADTIRALADLPTDTPAEMLDRWRRLVTGTGLDTGAAPFVAAQAATDERVDAVLGELRAVGGGEPFADLATDDLIDAQEAADRLALIAVAWATPGSRIHERPEVRDRMVAAFAWMIDTRYHAGMDAPGNWWHYRIGIPLAVLRFLTVAGDELPAAARTDALDAVRSFTPAVTLTGANRAWQAFIVGLLGVVVGDEDLIAAARDGVTALLDDVEAGDGFSADGSFVQHANIAYTGGYGTSLLVTVADLLLLLHGSPWEYPPDRLDRVAEWVEDAFDPVMVDGVMMDAVRGREISREETSAAAAGAATLQALATLAFALPTAPAARVAAVAAAHLAVDGGEFWRTSDPTRLAFGLVILDRPTAAPRQGATVFRVMRRAVLHGDGFAFAVASAGDPIARFELLNGENLRGWYTGSGATALYGHGPDAYAGDYWATVDPYRLAGTTVDTLDLAGIAVTATVDPIGASGGVAGAAGTTAILAADDVDGRTGLAVRQTWVLLGDRIVALGSGITAASDVGLGWDGAPRRVETILDDRPVGSEDVIVGDGTVIGDSGSAGSWLTWTRGGDDLGYVLLDDATVHVERVTRTGTWSAINARSGDDAVRTQPYAEMWIDHGILPRDAGYAYVLLPGRDAEATAASAADPDIRVLTADADSSAVVDCRTGAFAAHFWRAGTLTVPGFGSLETDAAATVVLEPTDGGPVLTVAAAWAEDAAATVAVDGMRVTVAASDARREVVLRPSGLSAVSCG